MPVKKKEEKKEEKEEEESEIGYYNPEDEPESDSTVTPDEMDELVIDVPADVQDDVPADVQDDVPADVQEGLKLENRTENDEEKSTKEEDELVDPETYIKEDENMADFGKASEDSEDDDVEVKDDVSEQHGGEGAKFEVYGQPGTSKQG